MSPSARDVRRRRPRASLAFGILALAWTALAQTSAPAGPPNMVLIVADDQGWGDYSFMGHPHVRTPRLDRLAAEGLLFRRGYVTSSLCSPSLTTLLTGLYSRQHGITGNDPAHPPGTPVDPSKRRALVARFDRLPTLPRLLAGRGYVSFQA